MSGSLENVRSCRGSLLLEAKGGDLQNYKPYFKTLIYLKE